MEWGSERGCDGRREVSWNDWRTGKSERITLIRLITGNRSANGCDRAYSPLKNLF